MKCFGSAAILPVIPSPGARKPTDDQLEWSCKVAAAQEKLVRGMINAKDVERRQGK
ncbi:hypothetical protein [Paenibacillus lautus]|uniref:hypothetical protein n=1 Tax=Paenibacillus lautus TaxID=1401 RepID=UPI001596BC86|nr:hypothetical protein [Paenibacillus lautus]